MCFFQYVFCLIVDDMGMSELSSDSEYGEETKESTSTYRSIYD